MAADTHERVNPITQVRSHTPASLNIEQVGDTYPRAFHLSVDADVTFIAVEDQIPVTMTFVGGVWHPVAVRQITAVSTGTVHVGY